MYVIIPETDLESPIMTVAGNIWYIDISQQLFAIA